MVGKRKYNCNYDYFKIIDTPEKAYWLGFIMADGCVMISKRIRKLKTYETIQQRYFLKIALSSVDTQHLEKFNQCINSSYPVKEYINKTGYKPNSKYSRIIIEDKNIV